MKNFIVDLVSNRFGIILAALNLCYFASHGDAVLRVGNFFFYANLPAVISTVIAIDFVKIFVHKQPLAGMILENSSIGFFIVLQWLSIAWIAKTLAAKLRKINLK